jgi:hypothetical protein
MCKIDLINKPDEVIIGQGNQRRFGQYFIIHQALVSTRRFLIGFRGIKVFNGQLLIT